MSNTIIVDMDDICLDNAESNGMNWLLYLHCKYPKFKCTLFTIPGRSNKKFLDFLMMIPWVEVAMHGYNHDEKESIAGWQLRAWPGKKIYKGPNWKVTDAEVEILKKYGFSLAVKEVNPNWDITQWPLTNIHSVHGHCWIKGDWERVENYLKKGAECKFISEVI